MSEPATTEPPKTETSKTEPLPNPVLKGFEQSKEFFRQARIAEGLDKPPVTSDGDSATPTEETPAAPSTEAATPDTPASVLPDDVLSPVKDEPPQVSSAIEEIQKMELPKGAKEKTIADFGKLKSKAINDLTAAEKRIQELENKITASTSHAETEQLREKLKSAELKAAEIEEQWAKTSLATSPVFQREFISKETAALDRAREFLAGTEIDPRIIDIAAHASGTKRLEILENAGIPQNLVSSIDARLDRYDEIQKEKQIAIDNWRSKGAQWQEEEQKRVLAEQEKRQKFENDIWEKMMAKNNTLLPFRSSKDETWNSRATELKLKAKEIFNGGGVPVDTMAEVVQKGVAYDAVESVLNAVIEENKTLKSQIAKLQSAAPGGAVTQSNGTLPTVDPTKVDRATLSKNTFNEQMAKARGG